MINILFLLFFLNVCFCIKLPLISNVFGSHMVLQREKFVNVWGWSQNDIVTIVLENSNGHIVSNSQVKPDPTTGLWKTQLKPMPGNKEKFTLTISDKLEKQTLLDIVFGEVWLCSGQSNMVFPLKFAYNSSEELKSASQREEMIRFIDLGTEWANVVAKPASTINNLPIPWTRANATALVYPKTNTWPGLSALCYMFGRRLLEHFQHQVPVGLISSNWGGTIIQAWMPPYAITDCPPPTSPQPPIFQPRLQTFNKRMALPRAFASLNGVNPANNYTTLFNGMIHPFALDKTTFYNIKGVIWYQGEQNSVFHRKSGGPPLYACLFRQLIESWRALFGHETGFHFAQLSGSTDYYAAGDPQQWYPQLRLAQASVLKVFPDVCMATAVDLGDWFSPYGSVHSRVKEPLAARLFACALAKTYDVPHIIHQGPSVVAASMHTSHTFLKLTMRDVGTGLVLRGVNSTQHETFCPAFDTPPDSECNRCCAWFDVRERHSGRWLLNFHAVAAQRDSLWIALNSSVSAIDGVRYLYGDWTIATVFNSHGWPLTPFVFHW